MKVSHDSLDLGRIRGINVSAPRSPLVETFRPNGRVRYLPHSEKLQFRMEALLAYTSYTRRLSTSVGRSQSGRRTGCIAKYSRIENSKLICFYVCMYLIYNAMSAGGLSDLGRSVDGYGKK
jgi:hypothetical protein